MRDHEIDRILIEEAISPSPGFAKNVMKAVKMEAAAPPPIPFPWLCVVPGLVLSSLCFAVVLISAFGKSDTKTAFALAEPSFFSIISSNSGAMLLAAEAHDMFWILLAFLLTLASIGLSLHLTSRRV